MLIKPWSHILSVACSYVWAIVVQAFLPYVYMNPGQDTIKKKPTQKNPLPNENNGQNLTVQFF